MPSAGPGHLSPAQRVLVTGGCGFIGSALVRQLVRETRDRVATFDLLVRGAGPRALEECAADPRHALIRGDIRDAAAMREAFRQADPDVVFHLAAESHVDRSIDAPSDFVTTNVVGTAILLEAALEHWKGLPPARRAAFRVVHASTDEVFGSLGSEGAFTADSPYRPHAPYAATKAGSDHLARSWHDTYGLPVIVTCSSNAYGPWQLPEKLIPLAILKALAGEPVPVYGTGENVREWMHVEDHARALRLCAARAAPGTTMLAGGGVPRRNLDVVRAICAILDELVPVEGLSRGSLPALVADRPAHDFRYALDPAQAEREMGFRPAIPFEEGLRGTISWYLNNRDWWESLRAEGHRQERLGLSRAP